MEKSRANFSGKIGFVLAAAGSAVGLGNLWRFPYLAAKDGGGVFLLFYLVLALTFGFALLTTEIAIGRKTGHSPLTAYGVLHKKFSKLGFAACLVPVLILPYYCVIGGWVFKYCTVYFTGLSHASAGDSFFTDFITGDVAPMIFGLAYLLVTAAVVLGGVNKGIEKFSRVIMPILLVLIRWIAPSVRALSRSPLLLQLQFGMIPLLSYLFDYFTRIYTDLLSSGNQAAVEFMPFVCSLAYLGFVLHTTQEQQLRSQLEQTRNSLNLQVAQAVREIEAMRESQRKASTYRHDLRHHLQYISACIENGRAEAAQEYIHSVCAEIEASKVNVYCENEAANLILSSFAARAQHDGIDFRVHAAIPLILPLPDSDLCVLFSNALENALHAGQRQKQAGKPAVVETTAYEKDGRLFVQIANSCSFPVQFDAQGVPTTSQPGHGLGVRSICAIVEQYGGMYSFARQQDQFVLRISL